MNIEKLSDHIANELFRIGNGPTHCQRIQFLGGSYPDNEIGQGGMCKGAVAKFIAETLDMAAIQCPEWFSQNVNPDLDNSKQ